MTKAKGNMYGFVTHTWNPITGKCIHNCSYCYMKRWTLPKVHLNEKVLNQKLGANNYIFVCSGTDLFAENVSDNDIIRVLLICNKYDNKYLFQSKNPSRVSDFITYMPMDSIICTTIESNKRYPEMGNAPLLSTRFEPMKEIRKAGYDTMVTIEPIMDFDTIDLLACLKEMSPVQVNIGADSGNNNLIEPSVEKTRDLISLLQAMNFTKVHLKPNLQRLLQE